METVYPNLMTYTEWFEQAVCPVPANEKERITALGRYEHTDRPPVPEATFDRLADLAARVTGLPVCFINIITREKQYPKAKTSPEYTEIPRELSFCQYTIMNDEILEVCDTHEHEVFCHNPLSHSISEMPIRYYIGVPLRTPDGYNIGTLCLIDGKPNRLDDSQKDTLRVLADEVMAQYRLKAAKAELEQLNREKDELIRIVSHDLRNPLNGIAGFAEYLKSELQNEEHQEMLGCIEEATQSTLRIVNILLNSDYIKNQAFSLNCNTCDVAALTKETEQLLRPFNLLKKHQIKSDIPDSLQWHVDADKWKQIVGNLLSNASKFTPEHGTISISLGISDDNELEFEITDSGMGMDKSMLKQLFNGSKSIQRPGTNGEVSSGIGLLLIKRYVELHGGSIKVDSEPGKGSRFVVRIP